jgi:hypothetical protein
MPNGACVFTPFEERFLLEPVKTITNAGMALEYSCELQDLVKQRARVNTSGQVYLLICSRMRELEFELKLWRLNNPTTTTMLDDPRTDIYYKSTRTNPKYPDIKTRRLT